MPASGLAVRAVHLDYRHARGGQGHAQAGPVGAGALDTDGLHRAETPQPRQQCLIPGLVGPELFGTQHPAGAVQDRRGVRVLVGIHTAGDPNILLCHGEPGRPSLVNRSRAARTSQAERTKQ